MSKLFNVPIEAVDANPFRRLGDYPYVERKLEALQQSIKEVGLWEGVIARKAGNRYQIAFGHHRIEAARQLKIKSIPMVVRDLDDKQMLQFMGRENMEDYNADFLTMLETWEAAVGFLSEDSPVKTKAIDIARILGWTSKDGKNIRSNHTAVACDAASKLINSGYLGRDDLIEITVNDARELCTRTQERHRQLDKVAKTAKHTPQQVEAGKQQYAKAAKKTAGKVRGGKIAKKDIRREVDLQAVGEAQKSKAKAPSPVMELAVKALCRDMGRVLQNDQYATKLAQIEKALEPIMQDPEGPDSIDRVRFELEQIEGRAERWQGRLHPSNVAKVVPLKAIEGDK
jgi:ParB/RepB/Spo0J family partition protein